MAKSRIEKKFVLRNVRPHFAPSRFTSPQLPSICTCVEHFYLKEGECPLSRTSPVFLACKISPYNQRQPMLSEKFLKQKLIFVLKISTEAQNTWFFSFRSPVLIAQELNIPQDSTRPVVKGWKPNEARCMGASMNYGQEPSLSAIGSSEGSDRP